MASRRGTRQVGSYNIGGTAQWDGSKWVPVNVVHKGQKAKSGGKDVIADGQGNWREAQKGTSVRSGVKMGAVVGTYGQGKSASKGKPAPKVTTVPYATQKAAYEKEYAKYNTPSPTPTPTPTTDTPGRNSPPPRDVNNTGATGTNMGGGGAATLNLPDYAGGMDSFAALLGSKYGINFNDPINSAPLAGTPNSAAQQSLNPQTSSRVNGGTLQLNVPDRQITNSDGQLLEGVTRETVIDGDNITSQVIDSRPQVPAANTPVSQQMATANEVYRAPVGSGEEPTNWMVRQRPVSRREAFLSQSDSMMGLRAADANQGLMYASGKHWMKNESGDWTALNDKDQVRAYKDGKIKAQDLLSSALADVPAKAVDKAIETGNPESIDPDSPNQGVGGTDVRLNPSEKFGAEMYDSSYFNEGAADAGFAPAGVTKGPNASEQYSRSEPKDYNVSNFNDDEDNYFKNTRFNLKNK